MGYVGRGAEMERISQEGFLWGLGRNPVFFRPREARGTWLAVCFCISVWTNNFGL